MPISPIGAFKANLEGKIKKQKNSPRMLPFWQGFKVEESHMAREITKK